MQDLERSLVHDSLSLRLSGPDTALAMNHSPCPLRSFPFFDGCAASVSSTFSYSICPGRTPLRSFLGRKECNVRIYVFAPRSLVKADGAASRACPGTYTSFLQVDQLSISSVHVMHVYAYSKHFSRAIRSNASITYVHPYSNQCLCWQFSHSPAHSARKPKFILPDVFFHKKLKRKR